MTFQIERGNFGSVPLDGLAFIVLGYTPEAMGKGNWTVGVIADERADEVQREALAAIASGQAGGPIYALAPLVSNFVGVETAPIRVTRNGDQWSVNAGDRLDMAGQAAMGLNPDSKEPLYLDNTGHPAANRFALAHALKSHVHSLGFSWDETSGRNNGQFAPFSWRSA